MTTDTETPITTAPAAESIGITFRSSKEIGGIGAAMAKAQGQMENPTKSTENPFYHSHYADLAACIEAVKKPLADNEIGRFQFPTTSEPGRVSVETLLTHPSGQWLSCIVSMPVLREKKGAGYVAADDPQAVGLTITYARRYSLAAICGIAQADDDGNAGSGRTTGRRVEESQDDEHLSENDATKLRTFTAAQLPDALKRVLSEEMPAIVRREALTYIIENPAISAAQLKWLRDKVATHAALDGDTVLAICKAIDAETAKRPAPKASSVGEPDVKALAKIEAFASIEECCEARAKLTGKADGKSKLYLKAIEEKMRAICRTAPDDAAKSQATMQISLLLRDEPDFGAELIALLDGEGAAT